MKVLHIKHFHMYNASIISFPNVKTPDQISIFDLNDDHYYKDIEVTEFVKKYIDFIRSISADKKEQLFDLYLKNPEILNDEKLMRILL